MTDIRINVDAAIGVASSAAHDAGSPEWISAWAGVWPPPPTARLQRASTPSPQSRDNLVSPRAQAALGEVEARHAVAADLRARLAPLVEVARTQATRPELLAALDAARVAVVDAAAGQVGIADEIVARHNENRRLMPAGSAGLARAVGEEAPHARGDLALVERSGALGVVDATGREVAVGGALAGRLDAVSSVVPNVVRTLDAARTVIARLPEGTGDAAGVVGSLVERVFDRLDVGDLGPVRVTSERSFPDGVPLNGGAPFRLAVSVGGQEATAVVVPARATIADVARAINSSGAGVRATTSVIAAGTITLSLVSLTTGRVRDVTVTNGETPPATSVILGRFVASVS